MCHRSQRVMNIVLLFGFILCLLPTVCMAVEDNKLPEWVVDNISLPFPKTNKYRFLGVQLYQVDDKRYLIKYSYTFNEKKIYYKEMYIDNHKELSESSLDREDVTRKRLESIVGYLSPKSIRINNINYGSYFSFNGSTHCTGPMEFSLNLQREGHTVSTYMLIYSYAKKIKFQAEKQCEIMDGSNILMLNSIAVSPRLWPLGDDQLLLGGSDEPLFVVINAKKFDLALNVDNALIFEEDGIKIFWVKKSLVSSWSKLAAKEYKEAKKDKKMMGKVWNRTYTEYENQFITQMLNNKN